MSKPTKFTETFFSLDEDEFVGVSAADGMEEEDLLRAQHSQLGTIVQVLMNMLIYLSQGGNFVTKDVRPTGKFT